MNKRSLLYMSMVALLLLGAAAANSFAKEEGGMSSAPMVKSGAAPQSAEPSMEVASGKHHGRSLHDMLKTLGITDEQKAKIRDLYVGFRDRTRQTRADLMSRKDEKTTMMISGKVDLQKLGQIDEQMVKLLGDLIREKLKLRRDRLASLTPEQIGRVADWKAWKGFHSGMAGRHWGRMHRGGRHKDLGLSDDQKTKIRALYTGFRDRTRKARMELMSLKDQKETMAGSGKIDQPKLAQIDEQIVNLVTDTIREKLQVKRDRLALLTPEQISRMADWQAQKAFRSRMERMSPERMRHGRRG